MKNPIMTYSSCTRFVKWLAHKKLVVSWTSCTALQWGRNKPRFASVTVQLVACCGYKPDKGPFRFWSKLARFPFNTTEVFWSSNTDSVLSGTFLLSTAFTNVNVESFGDMRDFCRSRERWNMTKPLGGKQWSLPRSRGGLRGSRTMQLQRGRAGRVSRDGSPSARAHSATWPSS